VDQAKTEAAKLQTQAEAEARKLQEQSTPSASAPMADGQPGRLRAPAPPQVALPPVATPPAATPAPALDGAALVEHFLALRPTDRTDTHLLKLSALDENNRLSIETMDLQGSPVTSQGLATLPKFPGLKRLYIGHRELT